MSYLNNEVLKSSSYCVGGLVGGACLGLGYIYYTKKLKLEDLKNKDNYLSEPVYLGSLMGLVIALGLKYNSSPKLLKIEKKKVTSLLPIKA